MQHHDAARPGCLKVGDHAVDVEAPGRGVVVPIGADIETGAREDRAMVLPRGVGDQDRGSRGQGGNEIGPDLQRAGAAEALHRGDALLRDSGRAGSEHQLPGQSHVFREPVDAEVDVRLRSGGQPVLLSADALHQRYPSLIVEVYANAEVHLGSAFICLEGLCQTQDRIGRSQFDVLENRHVQGLPNVERPLA